MDKLKSSIEEASLAVDAEREKNVSLLHLIFPPDIAKRLWLGEFFLSGSFSYYASHTRALSKTPPHAIRSLQIWLIKKAQKTTFLALPLL